MEASTVTAIDTLIESFQKNTYTLKHVEGLLAYLVDCNEVEDTATIAAIIKVLQFCKKDFVPKAIATALPKLENKNSIKAKLIAVCWESGLDYNNYLSVFVDELIKDNELVALEVFTLISEMGEHTEQVKQAIEKIHHTEQTNYSAAHRIFINDSLQHLITLQQNSH